MAAKANAEQAVYKPGIPSPSRREKLVVFEQNPGDQLLPAGKVMSGSGSAKVLVCGELFAKGGVRTGGRGM